MSNVARYFSKNMTKDELYTEIVDLLRGRYMNRWKGYERHEKEDIKEDIREDIKDQVVSNEHNTEHKEDASVIKNVTGDVTENVTEQVIGNATEGVNEIKKAKIIRL